MATSEVVEPEQVRRALIYTRVSKDRKQSRSTAEQEAECQAVCDREGWDVLDVLSDNGRSASRYAKKDRPAWEDVKRRIANGGGVDVVVTWEASRNGRDLGEFVKLRDLCRTHAVLLNYSGRTIDFDEGRPRKGRLAVHANKGDRIIVESTHVGQPRRHGEVVEVVSGDGGHEHYRVRWDDDHESTYFPSSDCRVVATGEARSNWPLWS